MTDHNFAMSANVHHPILKSVFRLSANHAGVRLLAINLGDPEGYGHVSLLVTDEQWRAIVRDTDAEIVNTDIREAEAAARELGDDYAIRCPEFAAGCAETFEGDAKMALVTEHMFAAHPEAVGR
jgi:hypothetical protein